MNQKTFSMVAGVIFLAIAIAHLSRIIWGWNAVIGGWAVPVWFSYVGIVVTGFLAYQGLVKNSR